MDPRRRQEGPNGPPEAQIGPRRPQEASASAARSLHCSLQPLPPLASPCQRLPALASPCQPLPAPCPSPMCCQSREARAQCPTASCPRHVNNMGLMRYNFEQYGAQCMKTNPNVIFFFEFIFNLVFYLNISYYSILYNMTSSIVKLCEYNIENLTFSPPK